MAEARIDIHPPKFEEDEVQVSIDLVKASLRQLEFLETVNKHHTLYSGPLVRNAIRRYETCWLPLVAEIPSVILEPPLDVYWMWHCHMLAPCAYDVDCKRLIGRVVDHKYLSEKERKAAKAKTVKLWKKRFQNEPYEFDYDNTVLPQCYENYSQRCTYNLEAAAARQSLFYYQVSLPHYKTRKFLKKALKRYKKFLFLKKYSKDLFLVPCYDFDLIWHAHQVHPWKYKADTMATLGMLFNHDDSVTERSPDSKLSVSDAQTRELWKKFFGQEFGMSGAMYRGDPPNNRLANVDSEVNGKRSQWALILLPGDFETYTMPETIEQLWGPIPLPRLPSGVDNTCTVASHW